MIGMIRLNTRLMEVGIYFNFELPIDCFVVSMYFFKKNKNMIQFYGVYKIYRVQLFDLHVVKRWWEFNPISIYQLIGLVAFFLVFF